MHFSSISSDISSRLDASVLEWMLAARSILPRRKGKSDLRPVKVVESRPHAAGISVGEKGRAEFMVNKG
jgi:hypothetical protein